MNIAEFQNSLVEINKRWDAYINQGGVEGDSVLDSETPVVKQKEVINTKASEAKQETVVEPKKREYEKKEISFRDLVRLSPKIICKPTKGAMFPSKLLYEGKKIRPLAFIRLVCALNDVPVFTKNGDKFKVINGENLLSAMIKGFDLNDTFFYYDGTFVSNLSCMGWTVADFHEFLKQNSPKSLEKVGISKTFSMINVLVKMKDLSLFTDDEKKQFIIFPFDSLRDVSSSIELLSNTLETNYDVYGATMNPMTKIFIISRYFIDCDLTSKEISNIKQSL